MERSQESSTASSQPGRWRRAITAAIALPLLGLGLVLLLLAAALSDVISLGLGVGLLVIGVPFAFATVVPFGRLRRILIGVGAALFGLALVLGWVALVSNSLDLEPTGWLIAFVAAACLFYVGHSVAR